MATTRSGTRIMSSLFVYGWNTINGINGTSAVIGMNAMLATVA